MFAISLSQKWCLKNSMSAATITTTIARKKMINTVVFFPIVDSFSKYRLGAEKGQVSG